MNAHFNLHRFDEFSLNIYYYSILKKTCQPYKNAHRKVFPKWFTFQWVFFNLNSRNGPIASPLNFEKSLQPFIYKAFSISKKCRLPLSYHFSDLVLFFTVTYF